MAEEGTDALVELGADDVFELAGLIVGFGIVDGEGVLEEALGEAMAADNVAGAAGAVGSEVDFAIVQLDEAALGHAGEQADRRLLRKQREMTWWNILRIEVIHLRGLALFAADPNLFEQVIV